MKNKDKNIVMSKSGGFIMTWNNEDKECQIMTTSKGSTKWFKKQLKKCMKKDEKNNYKEGFYTDERNKSKVELFLCDTIHPLVWDVLQSEECNHTSLVYNLYDHNGKSLHWMGQLYTINDNQLEQLEEKIEDGISIEEGSKILKEVGVDYE
jgi:hydroxymethylpyrimidine/phosphomethylpyrimidine kinase